MPLLGRVSLVGYFSSRQNENGLITHRGVKGSVRDTLRIRTVAVGEHRDGITAIGMPGESNLSWTNETVQDRTSGSQSRGSYDDLRGDVHDVAGFVGEVAFGVGAVLGRDG